MPSRVYHNSSSLSMGAHSGIRCPRQCSVIVRVCKWFPVVFIVAVLSWGYYAYVIQLCLFTIDSVILKVIYMTLFHAIYVLTMWSYWQTIFTDNGHIPIDVK